MTNAQASAAIFRRWIRMWPGLSGGVPFSTDNNVHPEATPHARVAIVSLDSEQYTLSRENRKWQRLAFIEVRLAGQVSRGRAQLDALVEPVLTIFEGVRFAEGPDEEGIVTHAASPAELRREPDSDQLWFLTLTIPCEWYQRR